MEERKDLLSAEDEELFRDLYGTLLSFVAMKRHGMNALRMLNQLTMLENVKAIARDRKLIDECMRSTRIPGGVRGIGIMRSWKRLINGNFYIYCIQPDGTIFIDERGEVYSVKGMEDGFTDMEYQMPFPTDCTLLPMGKVIVCDGLMAYNNTVKDANVLAWLKDKYETAVRKGTIHYSI